MKDIEWSEAHTDALTEFDHYFNTRYQKAEVVPYVPAPAQLPAPSQKPALDETTALIVRIAPPVIALTALSSIVAVIGAVKAAVIGAGFAFIAANAVYIGGGVVAVVGVVLAFVGRSSISSNGSDGRNGSTGVAPQNIHVTVNVAGQTVTTNSK